MKKISMIGISFLGVIAVVTVMFFNACTSDPCKDVTCLNGGTCVSGTCDCATGYEGTDCSTISRDKFTDTWTVNEDCSLSAPASYIVSISNGTGITDVLISNMWDAFTNSVAATVNGNTITIASQEPDNDGFTVSGSGSISSDGNTITMSYTVTDTSNGDQDNCTNSVWTK